MEYKIGEHCFRTDPIYDLDDGVLEYYDIFWLSPDGDVCLTDGCIDFDTQPTAAEIRAYVISNKLAEDHPQLANI